MTEATETSTLRAATDEEQSIIAGSLEAVERGLFERFLSGKRLGIAGKRVVLVDEAVLALPDGLRDGAYGGLAVGVLSDDGFALDLQGAIIMARETRRQTVRVNEQATRLFLYGRDILGTSILTHDRGLRLDDHCIVTNPRHEALGIGRVVGSFKAPHSAVASVHDLGSYLRDE